MRSSLYEEHIREVTLYNNDMSITSQRKNNCCQINKEFIQGKQVKDRLEQGTLTIESDEFSTFLMPCMPRGENVESWIQFLSDAKNSLAGSIAFRPLMKRETTERCCLHSPTFSILVNFLQP